MSKSMMSLVLVAMSTLARADMIEIGRPADAAPAGHVALVVLPEAYREALANAVHVGNHTYVSIDLNVGTLEGVRAELFPYSSGRTSVALEVAAGLGLTRAGFGPLYGGGVRVQFDVAQDAAGRNALMISPGVDVLVLQGSPTGGGFLRLVPYTNVYFVGTSVDVSYVHQFAEHFGWEIGLHLGADVGLGGRASDGNSALGRINPELGLFTGFRF